MKKIIIVVFFVFGSAYYSHSQKQNILNNIDGKLVNNPNQPLRASDLNALLKSILNYPVDTLWVSGDSIKYKISGVIKTVRFTGYLDSLIAIQSRIQTKQPLGSYLVAGNNLADVTNITTARSNLGLGNVPNVDATNASNISSGTLADARLSGNVTVQGNSFNGANQLVKTGSDGKLLPGVIPALALVDTYTPASQAAMLALPAEQGDIAIRTDINVAYILYQAPASTLGNWIPLPAPSSETDPLYTASSWYSTTNNSSNWNTAYSWGNHAGLYLSVSGGTLTGALIGTNANFNGSVAMLGSSASLGIADRTNTSRLWVLYSPNGKMILNSATASGGVGDVMDWNYTTGLVTAYYDVAVSGSLSAGAINGTTATFSGVITSTMPNNSRVFSWTGTTGYSYIGLNNTSGFALFGVEGSSTGQLQTGDGAYATVLTTVSATRLSLGTNQVERLGFDGTTGKAVFSKDVEIYGSGNTNATNSLTVRNLAGVAGFAVLGDNSVVVTGSFTAGAISGTSGTFSGVLRVNNNQIESSNGTIINQMSFTTASGGNGLLGTSTNHGLFIQTNGTTALTLAPNQYATFASSVGINTPPSTTALTVLGVPNDWAAYFKGSAVSGQSYGLLISAGTTTGDYPLYIRDQSLSTVFFSIRGGDGLMQAMEGIFSSSVTATAFYESSDIRQKIVHKTVFGLDGIDAIQYTFNPNGTEKWGYSAQQVQKIISFAVTTGSDGFLKVDYTTVHTYKIMQLEQRISQLEKQLKR